MKRACIGVTEKGLLPVESMLIARYQMFSAVYWQHTARAETAMLQYLVEQYIRSFEPETLKDAALDALLVVFRDETDTKSLEWLRSQVSHLNLDGEAVRSLEKIADSLLKRDSIYWTLFELRYVPQSEVHRRIYDALSSHLAGATSSSAWLDRVAETRDIFVEHLKKHFKRRNGEIGEILLDVPPAGKDQIENVFVRTNSEVRPIHEMSPVANAVKESFAYWARKVRVFMAPGAVADFERVGINYRSLTEACKVALSDTMLTIEEMSEPTLNLGASSTTTKSKGLRSKRPRKPARA